MRSTLGCLAFVCLAGTLAAPAGAQLLTEKSLSAGMAMTIAQTALETCTKQECHVSVHVLGRKTTVGRTPDNDMQIDAKFISRHHAVILAGPAHAIIEDLNSTNGVMVNNRRITRQPLKDGDTVVIGKTQFRFVVRPPKASQSS